jgi:hypothetical protein
MDSEGILSKFALPMFDEIPDWVSESDEYLYRYPEGYTTEDGWVLLHGMIITVASNWDPILFYIESRSGISDFYIDSYAIITH